MTNTPHDQKIDLQEVAARHRTARQIITGLTAETPALAGIWHRIDAALADAPQLAVEVIRLRTELAGIRLDRANLAAAALATIAAHHDGEPDPLSYLRDELHTQGYVIEWGRA